jgi:putative methionine-R-sulfoxide reductase with GAF domain
VSALAAVDGIVEQGGDADDVLRAVVAALVEHGGCVWAGIAFVEDGELVLGPRSGDADEERRTRAEIAFKGDKVGELWADGCDDRALLDDVAARVATHVLLGWDTGGEGWEP